MCLKQATPSTVNVFLSDPLFSVFSFPAKDLLMKMRVLLTFEGYEAARSGRLKDAL